VPRATASVQSTLDVAHLARLSGGAVGLAVERVLTNPVGDEGTALRSANDAQRCDAARDLLDRWGPTSRTRVRHSEEGSWRFWNSDDAAALKVVAAHTSDLVRVKHATCKTPLHDSH
jgi:hypothetical protein